MLGRVVPQEEVAAMIEARYGGAGAVAGEEMLLTSAEQMALDVEGGRAGEGGTDGIGVGRLEARIGGGAAVGGRFWGLSWVNWMFRV